jgi:hypothetical protein
VIGTTVSAAAAVRAAMLPPRSQVGACPGLDPGGGEWGGDQSPTSQSARKSLNWILTALFSLTCVSASAKEGEVRWRVFDQLDQALLVIADTDEATDSFGSPMFSCTKKSGNVNVEGEAKENLRVAMANLIRANETPWIQVMPDTASRAATVDLVFSEIDGWRYKFGLSAGHKSFERFKRDGVIEFKLGKATVHEEFKAGLENIVKFFDLCERPRK